jgi:hypothetical protein
MLLTYALDLEFTGNRETSACQMLLDGSTEHAVGFAGADVDGDADGDSDGVIDGLPGTCPVARLLGIAALDGSPEASEVADPPQAATARTENRAHKTAGVRKRTRAFCSPAPDSASRRRVPEPVGASRSGTARCAAGRRVAERVGASRCRSAVGA